MRMRFRELIGKKVVGSDGQKVGRVAELVARREGEQLVVCALRVGPVALWRRIAFRPDGDEDGHKGLDEIPWRLVERVEKEIHLKVTTQAVREARDEREQSKDETNKRSELPT